MKKLTFSVTLTFDDEISEDNEVLEVAQNIANAIVAQANEANMAPNSSDNYTKHVAVQPEFLDEVIKITIV